jgi:uncharacterized Zn-finger protein
MIPTDIKPKNNSCVTFKNDKGVAEIGIGVSMLKCAGETPPRDHPHVYLNMGTLASILCPYCATKYIYFSHLSRHETDPPGNFLVEK